MSRYIEAVSGEPGVVRWGRMLATNASLGVWPASCATPAHSSKIPEITDAPPAATIEPTDPPGLNFQWPIIEGLHGDLIPPFIGVNKRPVIDYDHGEGTAVIGGLA